MWGWVGPGVQTGMRGGTGLRRGADVMWSGLRAGVAWPTRVRLPGPDQTAAPFDRSRRAAKRTGDVVVAAVLLIVLLPVFVVVAVAVVVETPGPVFYRAQRTGHRSAPVGVLKFRKMRLDAGGRALTARHDERLTRVGALLVRGHLDELPQLWNVLRGDMSLVGPRPEDPRFAALHPDAYRVIAAVRPGLTGWTQLVWVDECDALAAAPDPVRCYVDEVLPRKVELDVAYTRAPRLATDLKILLWTPLVLVLGLGAVVDLEHREVRLVRSRPRWHTERRDSARPAPVVEEAAR